jgi:hypothetical protein
LASHAAACAIQLSQRGDLEPQERQKYLGEAIELLDQARSIVWSQAASLRTDVEKLRKYDETKANEFERLASLLAKAKFHDPTGDPVTDEEERMYRSAAEDYTRLVDEIRTTPGTPEEFSRFLLPPPIAELQEATSDGHIVVANFCQFRCDVIIMRQRGQLKLVEFSDTTMATTERLAQQFATQVKAYEHNIVDLNDRKSMNQSLHELWSVLGKPVIDALGLKSTMESCRVWWYMTGPLTFLLIHACSPKLKRRQEPGMVDLVISSYTSTISALLQARNRQTSPPLRMLAVANSKAVRGSKALSHAKSEVDDAHPEATPVISAPIYAG